MAQDGFITNAQAETAKRTALSVTQKATSTHTFAAEYFAEEVRRELYDRYGEKKLYDGGLSVRTTLDTKLQVLARQPCVSSKRTRPSVSVWRASTCSLVSSVVRTDRPPSYSFFSP